MARSGDFCEFCELGQLIVYSTRIVEESRVRYLKCNTCGKIPEKNTEIVPLKYARKRINRRKMSGKRF